MAGRRSFDASDQHTRGELELTSARLDRRECTLPYRAVVLGTSAGDVVQAAGGLMFDRMRSGWEVVTIHLGWPDDRPLRILGAKVIRADSEHAQQVMIEIPHALVVSADLLRDDTAMRQWIQTSRDISLTTLSVWDHGAVRHRNRGSVTEHRLSWAARIFKSAALRAASVPVDLCAPTEIFRNGR